MNADAPVEEAAAEEEEEEEEEDAWASDSDELVEEGSYEKIEGDVPRLYPGAVWDEYVLHNMAETTVQGLARLRLKICTLKRGCTMTKTSCLRWR